MNFLIDYNLRGQNDDPRGTKYIIVGTAFVIAHRVMQLRTDY
jgi:hypothetical protein